MIACRQPHQETTALSILIDALNERFGTVFTPSDQLFFDQIKEDARADGELRQAAEANTYENFGYVFLKTLEDLFVNRLQENEDIAARYFNDKSFAGAVAERLQKEVYDDFRSQAS